MDMDDLMILLGMLSGKARRLLYQKAHDYSGNQDKLKNLKLVEAAGICTAEQGVLVRMLDKLSRAAQLDRPGNEAEVKDESLRDTMVDLINYACLHEALREERMEGE